MSSRHLVATIGERERSHDHGFEHPYVRSEQRSMAVYPARKLVYQDFRAELWLAERLGELNQAGAERWRSLPVWLHEQLERARAANSEA